MTMANEVAIKHHLVFDLMHNIVRCTDPTLEKASGVSIWGRQHIEKLLELCWHDENCLPDTMKL